MVILVDSLVRYLYWKHYVRSKWRTTVTHVVFTFVLYERENHPYPTLRASSGAVVFIVSVASVFIVV